MKSVLKWTALVLIAALAGLALAYAYTGAVSARRRNAGISMDQAAELARQSIGANENPQLVLTEVMEFTENFYVEVEEQNTGIHAFELLVDRDTGAVYPEPGPNMMWNTRYGHMGGMMGSGWRQDGPMAVDADQAMAMAQKWLDRYMPGTSVSDTADAFYGYYTIHILKNGQVYGMLSVNGYTGDVWFHNWHGAFIQMKELEN